MSTAEWSILEDLDNAFRAARRSYKKIMFRLSLDKYEMRLKIKSDKLVLEEIENVNYREVENMSPTNYLYKLVRTWRKTGGVFRKEIQHNYINQNPNYFSFLNRTMKQQYLFYIENFPDALNYYYTEREEAIHLASKLNKVQSHLNKSEVILAMQCDFINLFVQFEKVIVDSYVNYNPYLRPDGFIKIQNQGIISELDFYPLKQMDEDNLLALYEMLIKENYMECSFDLFKQVFRLIPKTTNEKILWKDIAPKSKDLNKQTLLRLILSLSSEVTDKRLILKFIQDSFRSDKIIAGEDLAMNYDNLNASYKAFIKAKNISPRQKKILQAVNK